MSDWDFLEVMGDENDCPPPPSGPQYGRKKSISLVAVRQGDSEQLGIENEDGSITIFRTKSTLSNGSSNDPGSMFIIFLLIFLI